MAQIRNSWKFPLQLRCLNGETDAGGYIASGEIMTVSGEVAAEASATGVIQWLDGPDGYDDKAPVFKNGIALTEEQATGQRQSGRR